MCVQVLLGFYVCVCVCVQRILEFTGWDPQSPDARGIHEIHEAFFEILFDKTADESGTNCERLLRSFHWLGVHDAQWDKL